MRRILAPIITLDQQLMARSASIRPSGLDTTMQLASTIANNGKPWIAIATLLARHPGPPRRAAVRGMLSVAASSALANVAFKLTLPRIRPDHATLPLHRRRIRPPRTSSFPSGHSAIAAAFATGVALESPALGLAVAPLAATVAYSRVHNGVHWPSDVIVGSLIGIGVAFATRRWWAPQPPAEPARITPGNAPALPAGEGLLILANPGSGSTDHESHARITELLPAARIVEIPLGDTSATTTDNIRRLITEHQPTAIGVLGGDGTVRTVAAAIEHTGHPLAVFPGGTLNHFALDIGTPTTEHTARAVTTGQSQCIDTATAQLDGDAPHAFLNTASLGTYPAALQARKNWEQHLGKWIPLALGMIRELAAAQPLCITLNGQSLRARTLFIGNGTYHPTDRIPVARTAINGGTLDIRLIRADHPLSYTRALYAVATGTLRTSPIHEHLTLPELEITLEAATPVALDGDPISDTAHLRIRTNPHALTVYSPCSPGQSE
ncbi:bifunctional phosphatase PAP2/diacylglycerol kinase family protein [Lolliginicoccus suaedae]|uniref:bifunctional phosphatase PAP2/diacylglycerol kinase family protein n=1 Tax=Lolliginicoccus suaedae TaxID=2605429 RepID=UPI0011EE5252|nr:bifunctional phosphatase PAP2/diacylglycerol kinase family protein [Lolliginicoccus suaedae]